MKIIEFEDGMYGLRRFSLFDMCYLFKDLTADFWWDKNSGYLKDCKGSLEEVQAFSPKHKVFSILKDK